jgi:hypothetical protein
VSSVSRAVTNVWRREGDVVLRAEVVDECWQVGVLGENEHPSLAGCLLEEFESKAKPMFVVVDKRLIEDERCAAA